MPREGLPLILPEHTYPELGLGCIRIFPFTLFCFVERYKEMYNLNFLVKFYSASLHF